MSELKAKYLAIGAILLVTLLVVALIRVFRRRSSAGGRGIGKVLSSSPHAMAIALSSSERQRMEDLDAAFHYVETQFSVHLKQLGKEDNRCSSRVSYICSKYLDQTALRAAETAESLERLLRGVREELGLYGRAFSELLAMHRHIASRLRCWRFLCPSLSLYWAAGRMYRLQVTAAEIRKRLAKMGRHALPGD